VQRQQIPLVARDQFRIKPRPRRASTRRAEQIDNSSSAGRRAQGPTLAELARSYHVGKSTISRLMA
jgi:hypothetical protein